MKKNTYLNIFTLSAIILFSHSAYATQMKCACDSGYEATVNAIDEDPDHTFTCNKEDLSDAGTTNSMSVQETNVKFYIDSATREKPRDSSATSVDFRPRNGKCLEKVSDGNSNDYPPYTGTHCNNDTYETVSGITLDKTNEGTSAQVAFEAEVTGPKTYEGVVLYTLKSDTNKYFAYALCIEDK